MDKKKKDQVDKLIESTVQDVLKWTPSDVLKNDISSGNINYIYRVQNAKTGDSVIFKFADNETRVKPDGFLSPERNAHEATCLEWYSSCDPRFVPDVFYLDRQNHFFVMEDIQGAISLREALMKNLWHKNLGSTIAFAIIELSFPLLDILREGKEEELPCWNTASTDLLELTEKLVFEDPYYNRRGKNVYTEGNEDFIKDALGNDDLLEWVEKLKNNFKTNKQTLIHGDLHTGSILVRTQKEGISNKKWAECFPDLFFIDPEFAFYGPLAYDIGNVVAHLFFTELFTFYRAKGEKEGYLAFEILHDIKRSFLASFRSYAEIKLSSILEESEDMEEDFVEHFIQKILTESLRYAGCEIIRRVVGSAKVPELTLFTNTKDRILLERELINNAVELILYAKVDDYLRRK